MVSHSLPPKTEVFAQEQPLQTLQPLLTLRLQNNFGTIFWLPFNLEHLRDKRAKKPLSINSKKKPFTQYSERHYVKNITLTCLSNKEEHIYYIHMSGGF